MTWFGGRRGRTVRLGAAPVSAGMALFRSLANRHTNVRVLMCLMAVLAIVVAVQGWRPPFPYQLGSRPDHGIAARVDFQRELPVATERERDVKAAQVPLILRNDPALLDPLPSQLRAQLRQLAERENLNVVPAELAQIFNLVDAPGVPAPVDPRWKTAEARFQTLKQAARDELELSQIEAEFRDFLSPLRRTGLLASSIQANVELRPDENLEVVSPDGRRERVMLAEIRLPELMTANGRLGESWSEYPALAPLRPMLESWIAARMPETLTYDAVATQQARERARASVPPVMEAYRRGQTLVAPGDVVTAEKLALLTVEHEAVVQKELESTALWWRVSGRMLRTATVTLLVAVLAVLIAAYVARNEPALVRSVTRLSVYLAALVLGVAAGRFVSVDPWRAEVIPLAATAMVVCIAYNQVLATVTALAMSLILALSSGAGFDRFVVLMSATAAAIVQLTTVSSRSKLILVGFWSGVIYFALTWGMRIALSQSPLTHLWDATVWTESLRGAGWCLAAGFIVAGSLPFIESAFGVVTDISLLELGDVSHPLLQELVRRAPGTYNHSITVASLGEAAADAIGANGLLVRVGAYFHDIGKMLKPQYFIENTMVGAESRHEHLNPAMSTLIIIGHVKDGVDLAEQYNLPQPLIDFIEQHHGTTLVEYFYHQAKKGADPHRDAAVQESSFRYPGPKPQTREAGVLMITDAVEGASRTLSEPTSKRLERLVADIVMKRLLDGQFEESGLTMTEIHLIEQSLVKSLIALYHGRIKYPEQRSA